MSHFTVDGRVVMMFSALPFMMTSNTKNKATPWNMIARWALSTEPLRPATTARTNPTNGIASKRAVAGNSLTTVPQPLLRSSSLNVGLVSTTTAQTVKKTRPGGSAANTINDNRASTLPPSAETFMRQP